MWIIWQRLLRQYLPLEYIKAYSGQTNQITHDIIDLVVDTSRTLAVRGVSNPFAVHRQTLQIMNLLL